MDGVQQFHPLDRLIGNRTLSFLEAMVPFVDYPFKKPLVMFIKYQELMCIFRSLDNKSLVDECGFNCHPKNTEDMIADMCKFLPGNYASSIRQMRQMMQMMETMNMTGGGNPFGNNEDSGTPDMSKVFQIMQSMNTPAGKPKPPRDAPPYEQEPPSHDAPPHGWESPPHDAPPHGWEPPPHDAPPHGWESPPHDAPPHGWEPPHHSASPSESEPSHHKHSLYDSVLSILDENKESNRNKEFNGYEL